MAAAKESTPFIQPRVADKPSGAKAERAEISSISHAFPRALNVEGSKAGQFVIDTLGVEDEAEYYRLSGEVFAAQNVIIKELGISSSDWHKFERWDSAGFTDSGLSLAVRDLGVDGKPMVAFLAAHPFSFSRPPPSPKQLGVEEPAKLQAFFDFVAPVWIGAYMGSCPSYSGCLAAFTGRTLRIIAGGTRAGYEGRGLQMELRRSLISLTPHGTPPLLQPTAHTPLDPTSAAQDAALARTGARLRPHRRGDHQPRDRAHLARPLWLPSSRASACQRPCPAGPARRLAQSDHPRAGAARAPDRHWLLLPVLYRRRHPPGRLLRLPPPVTVSVLWAAMLTTLRLVDETPAEIMRRRERI
jgi:hypothetical protein